MRLQIFATARDTTARAIDDKQIDSARPPKRSAVGVESQTPQARAV